MELQFQWLFSPESWLSVRKLFDIFGVAGFTVSSITPTCLLSLVIIVHVLLLYGSVATFGVTIVVRFCLFVCLFLYRLIQSTTSEILTRCVRVCACWATSQRRWRPSGNSWRPSCTWYTPSHPHTLTPSYNIAYKHTHTRTHEFIHIETLQHALYNFYGMYEHEHVHVHLHVNLHVHGHLHACTCTLYTCNLANHCGPVSRATCTSARPETTS